MSEGEGGVSITGHRRRFEFRNGMWEVGGGSQQEREYGDRIGFSEERDKFGFKCVDFEGTCGLSRDAHLAFGSLGLKVRRKVQVCDHLWK